MTAKSNDRAVAKVAVNQLEAEMESQAEAQRGILTEAMDRLEGMPTRPCAKLVQDEGGAVIAAVDNPVSFTVRIHAACGSSSADWVNYVGDDLIAMIKRGDGTFSMREYNAALAFIASIEPRNEMEAALAVQMFGAHRAGLMTARGTLHSDHADQMGALGNLSNKFMRTFALQMEALSKIRRGGEQIIKHVHIHDGGQAVVADQFHNHQGVGGKLQNGAQSQTAIEAGMVGSSAALWSSHPSREPVPIARDAEREMQDARRNQPRRAQGK